MPRAVGVTRCDVGAGGGSRTRTRGEPNGILSARLEARPQGNNAHKGPHGPMMAESDGGASSPWKHVLLSGSSTERAQRPWRPGMLAHLENHRVPRKARVPIATTGRLRYQSVASRSLAVTAHGWPVA